jgi:hypothetical protein
LPDTEDASHDCALLLSDAVTPLQTYAARVLREILADESVSVLADDTSLWTDILVDYQLPTAAAALALRLGPALTGNRLPPPLAAGAAALRADFKGGPGGLRAAISQEVNLVFVQFAAIKLVPISGYSEALALYPDQVSLGHVMLAFRAKVKPDGTHDVNKARIAIADKADAAAPCQYYAGCANPVAVRLATQLRLQMPEGVQTTVDVSFLL